MQQRRREEGGRTRDEAGAPGPMSDSATIGAYRSQKIILLLYETIVDHLNVPPTIVPSFEFNSVAILCSFAIFRRVQARRVKMFGDV